MSHISSINFKKSKDFQVFHNANIRPSYAIGGELSYNRKGYETLKIKQELIQNAIEAYNRTKPPKAPNFKAKSYEWSAVCNIKPDTTMQDLERLAKHFETKYGFQCYQIAIHRDEGHILILAVEFKGQSFKRLFFDSFPKLCCDSGASIP